VAQRRAEAEQEAAAAEEDEELDPRQLQSLETNLLTAGRLPNMQVLQVAAEGFACDAGAVARHIDGLRCVVSDLELPSAVEKEVCVAAYFGQLQAETLSLLVQQLSRVDATAPPAPSARTKAASPAVAPAGVGALPEGGVEGGFEGVVLRARAAFEARLGQSPVEEEEEEDAAASPAEAGPKDDFDS